MVSANARLADSPPDAGDALVAARAWILGILLASGAPSPAGAVEIFRGVELGAASGLHLAIKDTPVFDTPERAAASAPEKGKAAAKDKGKEKDKDKDKGKAGPKKADDLKKGDEVSVFGKSGSWLAVQKGDVKLGFVAADAVLPILDGTLAREIAGSLAAGGHDCRYTIRFEGRTEVEIGSGRLADYSASFACGRGSARFSFEAPMFMSEMPHQGGPRPVYQIALDVLGVSPDPDQAFSTILFYDRDKGEVAVETAWPAEWLAKTKPAPRRVARKANGPMADEIAAALAAAAELTLAAWGPKPWEAIAKR